MRKSFLSILFAIVLMTSVTAMPLSASALSSTYKPLVYSIPLGGAYSPVGKGYTICNTYYEEGNTAVSFITTYLYKLAGTPSGARMLSGEHGYTPSLDIDVRYARADALRGTVTMEGRAVTTHRGGSVLSFFDGSIYTQGYGKAPIYYPDPNYGNVEAFELPCNTLRRVKAQEPVDANIWKTILRLVPAALRVLQRAI